MSDQLIVKSLALFFFYSLMDEKTASTATQKVFKKCKNKILKQGSDSLDENSLIVHYTSKEFQKFNDSLLKGQASISYEAGWVVPKDSDLGLWKDFKKDCDQDEFLCVIWSKILGFSDEQISEGLGVTVGTIRHRVGRGLRVLGLHRKGNA